MQQYLPAADLLQDRVILVTGAGGTIGSAVAKALAGHGATVVLLGRRVKPLETVYDEIEAGNGAKPAIIPINLATASWSEFQNIATNLDNEFGRLDGLLHNAATLGTLAPFEHQDIETWQKVMQVNLHAPFLLTRACLPLLKRSTQASVLFTTCGASQQRRAFWGAYGVSKAGLETMMYSLADELENHASLRVFGVDPGPIRSRLRAAAFPAEDPSHLPEPTQLTGGYLYLMGPDGRDRHGQIMRLQTTEPPASTVL